MKVKYPLSRLHCLSEASLQAAGFLAVMNFRITRVRNRERLFLLFSRNRERLFLLFFCNREQLLLLL